MTVTIAELASDARSCAQLGSEETYVYFVDWCASPSLEFISLTQHVNRLVPIGYDILLLCLALFKATGYWKLNGFHGSQLVFVVIKDQVLYFILCVTFRTPVALGSSSHFLLEQSQWQYLPY